MSAAANNRLRISIAFDAHAGWIWRLKSQGRVVARAASGVESIPSARRAAETIQRLIGGGIEIEVERRNRPETRPMHPWSAALRRPAGLPVYPAEASEEFEEEEAEEQPTDR